MGYVKFFGLMVLVDELSERFFQLMLYTCRERLMLRLCTLAGDGLLSHNEQLRQKAAITYT